MTTYYLDFVNGSDSNNGLGPDASAATNKPWKTLSKAVGASGMASGDIAYAAPGSFREVVTLAMTSATSETRIVADPANAQGFKTAAGVLVPPGDVVLTGYTTDDVTTPSTTSLLTMAARDFLTFENWIFIGSNAAAEALINCASGQISTDITFKDCLFVQTRLDQRAMRIEVAAGAAATWTFDRCSFFGGAHSSTGGIALVLNRHTADYDAAVLFRNCFFSLGAGTAGVIRVASGGSGSGFGGGVDLLNCTSVSGTLLVTADANLATSIPCTVLNSVIYTSGTGLSANTAGQITEDWNYIWATTRDTNVTDGSNSISGNPPAKAPLFEFDRWRIGGRNPRNFFGPAAGSPLLGFGSSGAPSVDIANRPRPSGGQATINAVGAYERHDMATQETTVVDASGSGLKIVGPGDQDIKVPVDATATTISIKARYDSTHAATNKPQVILLANPAIGVTTETLTMTAAVDTWQTLTTASQTPTAKGVVTLRLVSRSAAGGGIAYFDSLS